MDKDLKKDNELLDELFDEKEVTEEPEAMEQLNDEEAFESLKKEEINLFLTDEEILKLTEDEVIFYRQSIEMALERYDKLLMTTGEEIYSLYEAKLLKQIEKKLYKTTKLKEKGEEKKGFFSYLKVWMAIYGIILFLLNIFPINPFLPGILYNTWYEKMPTFLQTNSGFDVFMIVYFCLNALPGFIIWFFLKKETEEEKKSKWIFFGISCIIAVLVIVGVIIYLKWLR